MSQFRPYTRMPIFRYYDKSLIKDGESKESQILKDFKTEKKKTILYNSKIIGIQVNKKVSRYLLPGFDIITYSRCHFVI